MSLAKEGVVENILFSNKCMKVQIDRSKVNYPNLKKISFCRKDV